ncbi:STRUBBELIG-receptor family 8 [Prunus dulcis]|uniref:non-specific serine/threonine protein kinase n=1 Tax=Prunus dulcis TaxID=3755 RepID=A0A4Y1RWA0_PRUDU|nr:STRUBBELIG-receptor family 8 [Prunus dulcis]
MISTCTLDFTRFPYEAQSQCFDLAEGSFTPLVMQSCCSSALQSLYQAMTIKASQSRSIFLEFAEAQNCTNIFQNLHHRTNINNCDLQDFICSSTPKLCSNNVDSVIGLLGDDMYNALLSNCKGLSSSNHSDEACFDCVVSYRQSLQALKERNRSESPWPIGPTQNQNKGSIKELHVIPFSSNTTNNKCIKAHILGSKKLLAIVILAAALITRKQLQYANKKDIEILSVSKKTVEEESRSFFNCSGLYLFSQDEVLKATNHFDDSNLIGEATLGKFYVGIMPSGMPTTIKRLNQGIIKVQNFGEEVIRKAKIRHPNVVTTLGYCDTGEHCLVYEYCVNGNLAGWLLGKVMEDTNLDMGTSNADIDRHCSGQDLDSNLSNCKPNETKGLQTIKNDVFDFGVVLLQVLTGKKSKSVVEEAREAILKGASISGMADPRLNGAYVSSEFRNVLSIAVRCTAPSERERPYMEEIVRKLEETQSLV